MDIRLQKKLKNDNLYYLVSNIEKKVYNDWFLFENHRELPLLEKYFFDVLSKELKETFGEREYSSVKYKSILLIMYNITFDGDKMDIKSSNLISNLYLNIRYKDMANAIDALRNKYTANSIETYKNFLLSTPINQFSIETRKMFNTLKEKIGKDKDEKEILKELLYLCIFTEYNKALQRAQKMNGFLDEIKNIAKKENINFDEWDFS